MNRPLRVLLVEDSDADAALLLRELQHGGFDPQWQRVGTAADLSTALARQEWDLVLSDYTLSHFSGLAALELVMKTGLGLPFIIVSGAIGEEVVVAAMKAGTHDYLMKDKLARLVPVVTRELAYTAARRELQCAEAALRESSQFNQQIIANVREGIVVYDRDFRYLVWNPCMEEISGLPAKDVLGKNAFELFPFLLDLGFENLLTQALAGQIVYSPDLPYVVPQTGKTGWLSARFAPWRAAAGDIVGVIGATRDIAERKRAEEQIRAQASLLEQAHDAILVCEVAGQIQFWNQGAACLFGWSAAEIVGAKLSDLLGQDFAAFDAARQQLLEKSAWQGELRARNKACRELMVHSRWTLMRDAEGNPLSILAINTDITEKSQLEAQLLFVQA